MQPLVSIMIPTFNQPQYIEQAVKSALRQQYEYLEVIVSDDSTNDYTYQKIQPFLADNRFRYYQNKNKLGRVGNYRELLFKLAKGNWVVMLDGDDFFIDNQYIATAIDIINTNPSVVLVGAGIEILYQSTGKLIARPLTNESRIFKGMKVLEDKMSLPNHQTDLYPRVLAQQLDFYRDQSMGSDSESLFRLCLHGNVAYLKDIAATWRIHDQNTTFTLDAAKQIAELVFIDKVYDYSLKYIGEQSAKNWKEHMYGMMASHILLLPGVTVLNRFQLFWKIKNILPAKVQVGFIKALVNRYVQSVKNFLKSGLSRRRK